MIFGNFPLLFTLLLLVLILGLVLLYRKDRTERLVQEAEAKSKKAIQQGRIFEAIRILYHYLEQLEPGPPLSPNYIKRKKARKKILTKIRYLGGEYSEDRQAINQKNEKRRTHKGR